MNTRVRQLWAPVLFTGLISVAVQFVALSMPQLPPWVFFTRNGGSIVMAPLWMVALPFIGALGAWLCLRAGGNTRDRLLTTLGPAWLNGGILTLGVPLSMITNATSTYPVSRSSQRSGMSFDGSCVMGPPRDNASLIGARHGLS